MSAHFAVGVPRVLRCLPEQGGAAHEAVLSLAFTHCGSALLAVVTTSTLQVWGGGQARRAARVAPLRCCAPDALARTPRRSTA